MKKSPVAACLLDGVTNGVPEIEKGALTGAVPFILCHNGGLDADVAQNQRLQRARIRCRPALELFKHLGIGDHSVFDHFGETLIKLTRPQRLQHLDVVDHERWMVKRADQVFRSPCIHACLPADRAVCHRQQRCGNLDVRDAALINRRHKPRNVANNASAHAYDKGVPVQFGGYHSFANRPRPAERFRFLACGDGD